MRTKYKHNVKNWLRKFLITLHSRYKRVIIKGYIHLRHVFVSLTLAKLYNVNSFVNNFTNIISQRRFIIRPPLDIRQFATNKFQTVIVVIFPTPKISQKSRSSVYVDRTSTFSLPNITCVSPRSSWNASDTIRYFLESGVICSFTDC